jgi:DNA-directed RNA polymerase subunit beta
MFSQFGVGLARMARTIRESMNVRDNEVFTPIDLINSKTLSSVINSFFGTNANYRSLWIKQTLWLR